MAEYMHLVGAEQVQSAANTMRSATRIKDEVEIPMGFSRNLRIALAPDSAREPTPNRRGYCGMAGRPE